MDGNERHLAGRADGSRQGGVERVARVRFPTEYGEFFLHAYEVIGEEVVHLALVKGEVSGGKGIWVRVHSECLTGEAFHSIRCDCRNQLDMAMKQISEAGRGVIVYLRGHEGRGIGLKDKMRAYQLQDEGKDTVEANLLLGFPADLRDYRAGGLILADLGVESIRLLTHNPDKSERLSGCGFEIDERVPLPVNLRAENRSYLMTKRNRFGHLLDF